MLHKKDERSTLENPEGGLQASLCSNNVHTCGSPSGFLHDDKLEDSVKYISKILLEAFIENISYEKQSSKEQEEICPLLPCINQRTSR
jgi:hypothetical protein